MINANDIKVGMTIKYEGVIYQVIDTEHVKSGKGVSFLRAKVKNLVAHTTQELRVEDKDTVEKADVRKVPCSYLYSTGDTFVFMDNVNFEQFELTKDMVEDDIKFLKEGLEVEALFIEGNISGIKLPEKISYKVTYAPEAVKGNTTSGAQKDITIETGYTLKAPLFITDQDSVVITTRDGKYFSRG